MLKNFNKNYRNNRKISIFTSINYHSVFTRPSFLFFQHNHQCDTLLPIVPCTHKLKAGIAYRPLFWLIISNTMITSIFIVLKGNVNPVFPSLPMHTLCLLNFPHSQKYATYATARHMHFCQRVKCCAWAIEIFCDIRSEGLSISRGFRLAFDFIRIAQNPIFQRYLTIKTCAYDLKACY